MNLRIKTSTGLLCLAAVFYCGLGLARPAQAGMYSYTDKDGTIHITDNPPGDRRAKLLLTSLKRPKGFKGAVGTGFQYKKVVAGSAKAYGLTKPLLWAIIKTESNFNPRAVSPKGASGLMQLMPDTWKRFGVTDPFDPQQNVKAGSAFFRQLMAKYKNVKLALAAYNAGPGNVDKYGGIPPFEETRRYVRKVLWYYDYYRTKGHMVSLPGMSAYFGRGVQAMSRGNLHQADELFKRVVARYPKSPEANYNLALVSERIGKYSQALTYYKRTMAIDPYFKEAYYNLAILYEKLNRYHEAAATWQRYLKYEVSNDERRQVKKYVAELKLISRR